jgi:hypothetical protein
VRLVSLVSTRASGCVHLGEGERNEKRQCPIIVSVCLILSGCAGHGPHDSSDTDETGDFVSSGSTYNFKLPLLTNSCMDVNGAGTTDGTNIQEWRCNGGAAQNFTAQSLGNGLFKLVNPNSGKCVDVSGNGTTERVGRTSGFPGVAGESGGVRDVLSRRAETWVRAEGAVKVGGHCPC